MDRQPHILVIFGSTRQGRRGDRVVHWLMERLGARTDASFALVDVRALGLPLFDAPVSPARGQVMPEAEAWAAQVEHADGFIFVTPEYNHGYPASLKNAIDYLHHEWRYKPVGFVSYGGVASGTRSVEQLQQVVTAVKLFPLFEQVNIPFYQQFITDGEVHANEVMEQATGTMLDQLVRMEALLRPMREEVAQPG